MRRTRHACGAAPRAPAPPRSAAWLQRAGAEAPAATQVHRQTIKREEKVERVQGEFAVTDPLKMKASLLTPKPTDSTPSVESACFSSRAGFRAWAAR